MKLNHLEAIRMQRNHEVNSTKTIALLGLIFYGVATLGSFSDLLRPPWDLNPFFPWIFSIWRGFGFLLSVGFTIWAYITYRNINEGRYIDARTSSLLLGIFGLLPFIGSFLGGLFFLIVHWKLGLVIQIGHSPIYSSASISASSRFCTQCGRIVGADNLYCVQCGMQLPD